MRPSFLRKLVYIVLALFLFAVIVAVREPIKDIRSAHQLSDDTLGDVDPTSSTMVLVLGGLRGVAANVLWSQAQELQKEQNWYAYEPVVESIIKLQPHFIQVWTFQGWNLAYNISVEWDQVDDKYYWIKRGIKFLRRGTEVNERSPELRWDVGWTYFHKIGKADEAALLRKLYREDTKPETDAQGREQQPFNPEGLDNYMASLEWFQKAVSKCDDLEVKPKRMGEVPFRSYPAHARTDSVMAQEEEGQFGETIHAEWLAALELWTEFADHEYQYSEGKKVKLDYPQEVFSDLFRAVTLMTRVHGLNEGLNKDWEKTNAQDLIEPARLAWGDLAAEEWEKLTPEERGKKKPEWAEKVWAMIAKDTPRVLAEFGLGHPTIDILPTGAGEALRSMRSSFERIGSMDPKLLTNPGSDGERARKQLAEFVGPAETLGRLAHEELYWCDRYATMINYRYWKERAVAESERDTINTRQHFFVGLQRFREGDPETAKKEFEAGLEMWQKILDKYTRIRDDDLTAEETVKVVKAYLAVRDQLDLPPLPDDQVPFQHYVTRLTPTSMSPEQYEAMMQAYQQAQKEMAGEKDENKKREIMEKYKEKFKEDTAVPVMPKTQPVPIAPPPAPKDK